MLNTYSGIVQVNHFSFKVWLLVAVYVDMSELLEFEYMQEGENPTFISTHH
jgi:hypothetical protein